MHSGDVVFRFGLVMAAMLLLGIFGGQIARIVERSNENMVFEVASSLGEAADLLISGSGDGSLVVDLGIGESGSALSLPGRLNGQRYSVHVLFGLVYLSSGGQKVTSISGPTIIPTFPLQGSRPVNITGLKRLSRSTGGFSVDTPCLLCISKVEVEGEPVLFINNGGENSPRIMQEEDIEALVRMIDARPPPLEGHLESMVITIKGGAAFGSGHILFDPAGTPPAEGWCPAPVVMPDDARLPDRYDNTIREGEELFVFQRLEEHEDGTSSVVLVLV